MIERHRIAGVDFSGARNAGKLIWIASGVVAGGALRLETCFPAAELPGSGADRELALPALVKFLSRKTEPVVGLDFPFGMPAPLVKEKSWEEFIAAFPENHASADAFRESCMKQAGGRELKRRTDIETKTPFSAYNLRLYRQTYDGIRNILHPLITQDLARAIPTQQPVDGKPVLAEACPASLLKAEHLYPSYKGPSAEAAGARDNRCGSHIAEPDRAPRPGAAQDIARKQRRRRAGRRRRGDHRDSRAQRLDVVAPKGQLGSDRNAGVLLS